MTAFNRIFTIIIKGVTSFSHSSDFKTRSKWFVPFYLWILPLLSSSFVFIRKWNVTDYAGNLLLILSIFASMIFAIVFLMPDRIAQLRNKQHSSQTLENSEIARRLKTFEQLIVRRMSFFLVTTVSLIFLVFTSTLATGLTLRIISAIAIFLLYWFVWTLVSLISSIHILNLNK